VEKAPPWATKLFELWRRVRVFPQVRVDGGEEDLVNKLLNNLAGNGV
jgi:hypothetical protein